MTMTLSLVPLLLSVAVTINMAMFYYPNFVSFLQKFQPHPHVKDWFLTNENSPIYISTILITYLTISFIILPSLKKRNWECKNLRFFMITHNVLLVFINLYLAIIFLWNMVQARYNAFCEPVKNSIDSNYNDSNLATSCWLYFLSKLFELNDIVFNIFRTKPTSSQVNSQVYHHSTMVAVTWAGARYLPGGSTAIMSCINSTLHVIMYTYFACSGKTFDCGGFLDARIVIIICTLVQFSLVIGHCLTGIFLQCNYPTSAFFLILILVITYILSFSYQTYFCNCTIGFPVEEDQVEGEIEYSNDNSQESNNSSFNPSPDSSSEEDQASWDDNNNEPSKTNIFSIKNTLSKDDLE